MFGQDCRMRRAGLPGNVCCAVMKLGPGFDIERLRQRLENSPLMQWLARARLSRPLPLVTPFWRAGGKPNQLLFEHNATNIQKDDFAAGSVPAAVAQRTLHAVEGPGLTFDVLRQADGASYLFLSWNHTHLDARGLDLLLNYLNREEPAKNGAATPNLISPKQLGWDLAGWWPTIMQARHSLKWLCASGSEPLFSLVPNGTIPNQCRNHYRVLAFTPEETARIDARCQQFNCGFRRSHFYLAASVRALHTVAVQRGNKDGAYLIPVPHDTRKRGANGPIFSNHLSILFYRLEPRLAGRMSDILGELSRQMTDQIRERFPESCMAALEMFKPLPLWYYLYHLGKPSHGKFATFSFSDSGETCAGMKQLWGGDILDVKHLVPAWRPPGLTIIFLRFQNRLTSLISYVDDCLTPAEAEGMECDLRQAILEETD
jgi:hypothetical protein